MRPTSAHSGLRGPPLNLCEIIQRGYLSQVPLLVNLGVNIEARDPTGRTPLMMTAYVQPEEWGVGVARLLIEQGVRMSQRDKQGMNVLHHACIYERLQLVQVLLHALDFDLVQADKFGNTALHYAAMSGNVPLVKLLVSYHHRYRHPINKVNRHGRTARDEALQCGSHQCTAILEDNTISASCRSKDTDNQSESESNNTPVFVVREESVAASEEVIPVFTEEPKPVCTEESKMMKEVKTLDDEEMKLSLRREDEEGGLFRPCDQTSQDDINKNTLSPFHTPPTSDRSSDSKIRQNSSPRTRRSGIRHAHPPAFRRLSAGSSGSSRSGMSAKKQPLLSARSSTNTINNTNTENSTYEIQNSSENETAVQFEEMIQRPKTSSLQRLKERNVLSENSMIMNNTSISPSPVPSATRPPSKTTPIQSLKREPSAVSRSASQLLPYKKDPERVIHVASEQDFRNSREYVLKLTRLEFRPSHFDTDTLPALVQPPPSVQMEEDTTRKPNNAGNWRDNMRFLYHHLEYQCSPSWRDAAQPSSEPFLLTPQWGTASTQGDEVDEGKEKKIRRPSSSNRPVSQMNDVSTSSNTKRKPSANKQRKISAISPPSGPAGGDNLTVSSSDSASTGSKKKGDSRPDLAPPSN